MITRLNKLLLILRGYTPLANSSSMYLTVKDNKYKVWEHRGSLGVEEVYASDNSSDAYFAYNVLYKEA